MSDSRWYFTEEQLANSPSRKCGINAEQELSLRQRASNLIQDMGQRLQVSQLCINTAIVYMHRFYAFHSFTLFHRNSIAAAAFFLAAKVEEQPRKLEHVIKILNICLDRVDNARESYAEQAQELVFNENVLLQTLGFDVAIDHPHTHVVRACNLFNIVTVSRELRQTCYFMASNSLHLTTMCLKYKPTVVAAFCIYIACKWSRWEIPNSCEGKAWYTYVDDAVTPDILKKLTDEYLGILEKSPSKFKSKMKTLASNGQAGINQNPSVNARDETVHTPNQKTPHDKQHHHHHHHNSRGTGSSSSNNVRKQPGELSASVSASATSSSSSSSKQPQQSSSISAYKNQAMPQPGMSSSSNSHLQRQRPSSSSSSQQAPYPGNTDNSSNSQKAISEERTSHRQIPQETSNYGSSCQPRPIESHSKRLSSSQTAALGMQSSSSSQPQLNQHQPPHQKPTNNDQRHSQSASSKAPIDYHQKSMKHPQSTTSAEMHARSSSSTHSQSQQQQPSPQMKKPSWAQQQQQLQQSTSQPQNNLPKQTQSHVQSSHSQPNLTGSSSSSSRNNSQALPSYSESQKQLASQPSSQNDFWYNDKIHETTAKPISPIRQGKSMFSPSPDHDKETYDKRLLMMTSHVKRNESPKSDKQDRRTTTPNKREKKLEMQAASSIQKSSTQVDRKPIVPKLEPTTVPTLAHDPNGQMKKRPFSAIDEQMSAEFGRDSKARKVEIKSEPNHLTGSMMKQPIETNPDIVKSLLQECYTVNKFDSFGGMDSPLDVMNTEPTNTPSLTASTQPKTELNDASILKMEPRENGYEEEHHKRNKSKKSKKEKHKHKKKKSHKSDREDREDRKDSSLKTILSVDSKSSPENSQAPRGLKIKIPIKDVNKSELVNVQQLQLPPAPLKLKLSKEKFGGFSNSGVISDGSSSSSSHKKKEKDKDKDRSKSKSSKHGNNNNIPEYKDVGYHQQPQQQHQQLSMNKMSSSQVLPQNHQMQQQNSFDASMSAMFGNQQYQQQQVQQPGMYQYPQQQQQQQMMNHPQQSMMSLQQQQQQQQQSMMNLQQQQFQNYNYQPHPAMNNYSTNGSNSGKK